MDLFFLRHGNAGEPDPHQGRDERRRLDQIGLEQCSLAAFALESSGVRLDRIYSSPLSRAWQTAELVVAYLGVSASIRRTDSLGPAGRYEDFATLLEECSGSEAVLFVGHNSTLREYMGRLLGSGVRASLHLKKGGIAKLRRDQRGTVLQWCITPKLLRAIFPAAAYRPAPEWREHKNGTRRSSPKQRSPQTAAARVKA